MPSMTPRLEPRQKLEQRLTQKQQHSLYILTIPQAKLEELIHAEVPENPFLEIDEAWDAYLNQRGRAELASWRIEIDDEFLSAQQSLAKRPSLVEHLARQLCELRLSQEQLKLAAYIIGSLDYNGYLAASIEEIGQQSGAPPAQVEDVLKRIQSLDPVGVAARNARECLLVQLESRGEGESLAARIVAGHLEDFAAKRYGIIARELGVEVAAVELTNKSIRSLEPLPARDFDCDQVCIAIPEVIVERQDGEWRVLLADSVLPRFNVNKKRYRWLVKRLSHEQRVLKEELRKQLHEAQCLFRAVGDRQKTLLSVAIAIFERQEAFLERGRSAVSPMTMKEIAVEIGVSESTVSRAVSDKFVRTSQGIFPLKFFFQDGVARTDCSRTAVSSEHVKSQIRALIAAEDCRKPLTDDEIVNRLSAIHKIKMARRTVNKYRDLLKIPPANQRRREIASLSV